MKEYIKLLRIKHYLKNFLIFLALFFSSNLFDISMLGKTVLAFIIFCICASGVYVFNDIIDMKKDRMHPVKKNRPIASGKISKKNAIIFLCVLYGIVIVSQVLMWYFNLYSAMEVVLTSLCLLVYVVLNVLYTLKLKHLAIFDVLILSSGFVIRVLYGGLCISVSVSSWLYLTILSISLYMALGKRRGELINSKESRDVLKYYSENFLDKFMYVFLTATIVFYSLWCTTNTSKTIYLVASIILVIFIIMRYSLDIEKKESMADPVDVIYSDKVLIIATIIYAIYMGGIIYV